MVLLLLAFGAVVPERSSAKHVGLWARLPNEVETWQDC